jgi:hypothetical protein
MVTSDVLAIFSASAPSVVSSSTPSAGKSSGATTVQPSSRSGTKRARVGRRSCSPARASARVARQARGLSSRRYEGAETRTRLPSTSTVSLSVSTLRPSWLTGSPFTFTRPLLINSSARRREATPACARNFCNRMY